MERSIGNPKKRLSDDWACPSGHKKRNAINAGRTKRTASMKSVPQEIFNLIFFEKSAAHDLRTSAKSSSNPAKQAASEFRGKSKWPKPIFS
jgi:hypothetical protein